MGGDNTGTSNDNGGPGGGSFETGGGFGDPSGGFGSQPGMQDGLGSAPQVGSSLADNAFSGGFNVGELSSTTPPESFGSGFAKGALGGAVGGGLTGGLPGAIVGGLTKGLMGGLEATGGQIPGLSMPDFGSIETFPGGEKNFGPDRSPSSGASGLGSGVGSTQVGSGLGGIASGQTPQAQAPIQVTAPSQLTQPQFAITVDKRNPLQELALSGFR